MSAPFLNSSTISKNSLLKFIYFVWMLPRYSCDVYRRTALLFETIIRAHISLEVAKAVMCARVDS